MVGRALGRKHAGCGCHQPERPNLVRPGRRLPQRRAARGGALHAARRKHPHVRGHHRRSQSVFTALENRHASLPACRKECAVDGIQVHPVFRGCALRQLWQRGGPMKVRRLRMTYRWFSMTLAGVAILGALPAFAQNEKAWTAPRTADGHPDLQGIWTNKTITPLERPKNLGNKAFFTPEEAKAYTQTTLERNNKDNRGGGVRDV